MAVARGRRESHHDGEGEPGLEPVRGTQPDQGRGEPARGSHGEGAGERGNQEPDTEGQFNVHGSRFIVESVAHRIEDYRDPGPAEELLTLNFEL
jgi:hypothetical protein